LNITGLTKVPGLNVSNTVSTFERRDEEILCLSPFFIDFLSDNGNFHAFQQIQLYYRNIYQMKELVVLKYPDLEINDKARKKNP